jgi:hypothetical protein
LDRFLHDTADGRIGVDRSADAANALLDGKIVLRTSDP